MSPFVKLRETHRKLMMLLCILLSVQTIRIWAVEYPLTVCSFNIQFLGSSKSRDDVGLAEFLKQFDVVVVQELIAPPYTGKFPDGKPFTPDAEARHFFDCMKEQGFSYWLSEEDTGPGIRNHLNTTATEWWVVFYKSEKVRRASDLPSGFLSKRLAHNPDFDRVPYSFAFRTTDGKLDFVLISVHLEPGASKINKSRRKHELASIASWINANDQKEKDFIVLGDMNIENAAELQDGMPSTFDSLNDDCLPTNTNVNGPKPYDHVMFRPEHTRSKLEHFERENLIDAMRPHWKIISSAKYPGDPVYKHDEFRKFYSDHHPVKFELRAPPQGDDD